MTDTPIPDARPCPMCETSAHLVTFPWEDGNGGAWGAIECTECHVMAPVAVWALLPRAGE